MRMSRARAPPHSMEMELVELMQSNRKRTLTADTQSHTSKRSPRRLCVQLGVHLLSALMYLCKTLKSEQEFPHPDGCRGRTCLFAFLSTIQPLFLFTVHHS